MSLMPPTRKGPHTVCPSGRSTYCKRREAVYASPGPGLRPACLWPSVHVRMSQNPRLVDVSPFLGVMPTSCGTNQTSATLSTCSPHPTYPHLYLRPPIDLLSTHARVDRRAAAILFATPAWFRSVAGQIRTRLSPPVHVTSQVSQPD